MVFDFEIEGNKHSLYFGMVHKEIVEALSKYAVGNGAIIDDFTGLVFLVHAGLCNYADTKLTKRPEYEESYAITEKLAKHPDTVTNLFETWKQCEASKELIAKLPKDTSKKKVERKTKKQIGTE